MKRTVLLALTWACAIMVVSAQDVIYRRSGNKINAIVIEIGESDVSYKSYSNPSGPTYRMKQSEVVKIQYENGDEDVFNGDEAVEEVKAPPVQPRQQQAVRNVAPAPQRQTAQYNNYGNYGRGGGALDDMSYNAPDLYRSYRSGKTLSNVGMGLTLGGLAAAVIGFAAADKEDVSTSTKMQVNLSGTGAAVFVAGTVVMLVGTPIWIVGNTKKKNARNAYLRDYGQITVPAPPSPYLRLNGDAQSIMGLALVF